jgi:ABC-type Fe3+ transport system substrate-binding protein
MTASGRVGHLAFAASLALLAVFASHDAAADIKHTPQLDQLIKAAAAEGELNVMWGGSSLGESEGVRDLEAALNREFNINVKVNYTPGPSMPQLATRIIREVKAGQKASTDVFLGIEVSIPAMIAAEVIEPVKWSEYFPEITPQMTTQGGEALLEFTLFNGFSYNVQLIPDKDAPHTLAQVLRPEWKGKLASTPYAAGFDRLALAYGDDKIRPLVKQIAEWAGGLLRCGEYERIASGEFLALVLDCGQVQPRFLVENGGPVRLVPLDDALATTLTYFAVPKTSAHPNMAKLFAGFVATRDGQKIIEKYGATSYLVPGTPANKMAEDFHARGLELLIYTPDLIAPRLEEAAKYKAEYEQILQGK